MFLEKKKKWNKDQLVKAVQESTSYRQVLLKINLIGAGGNFEQVKKYIKHYDISIKHFKDKAWNKGLKSKFIPRYSLEQILVLGSSYQSHKLKNRLFRDGIKHQKCEMCGWSKISNDGRIPLELDHVNGNKNDNRIENLRILCPNCHSLQPTHRARNRKKK